MKNRELWPVLIAGTLLLSGCGAAGTGLSEASGEASSAVTQTETAAQAISDNGDMFTDRDLDGSYDADAAVEIALNGTGAVCDSSSVVIAGSTVTITEEGTYLLSGSLDDGMIVVSAGDTDKVQLVLNGVDITNADSAAIYILSADKVFLTLAAGSENILENGGTYIAIDDNNIDAVIFSKEDLTLNGSGSLTVNAAAGHGIVSKDDLVLTGGNYQITAASHGLSGKDSVRIAGGSYQLETGKDGIHTENADDAELGYVYLADGSFSVTASGDGISAASWLEIEGGSYDLLTGGGADEAPEQSGAQDFGFGREFPAQTAAESTDDSVSTKGIKAGTVLTVNAGTFRIDSADDALHSNGDLTVSGGSFEIATGDDGLHADAAEVVSGGEIAITRSYEGIEGLSIDISGGEIDLVASDDGLNAAGGNDSSGFGGRGGDMFTATEGACITISGGTLHVNASGDGIDSNGDLYVTGGTVYVSGPSDSANGALDYNGTAEISGGIFIAAGSSGMAQNFSSSSTQGAMMVTVDTCDAGSTITLYDSSGSQLISWQADKAFNSVVISLPELAAGETYTLTAGGNTVEITMDSLVYGSGGMGGGKMNGGWGGEKPEGNKGGRFGGEGGSGQNPAEFQPAE